MMRTRLVSLVAPIHLAGLALFLGLVGACQGSSGSGAPAQIPAVAVNDACSVHANAGACQSDTKSACGWIALPKAACPAGATCPSGVCAAIDPCAALADPRKCAGDDRCAWSATGATEAADVILCPVGDDCAGGGFCHARAGSGNDCNCVQPLVCPANGSCPVVACDCPPPPASGDAGTAGGSGGGGTCTCSCPACPPGEACPACACSCSGGGTGGGTGTCGGGTIPGSTDGGSSGGGGSGSGGGTCICNCPVCTGTSCPPCGCACGNGSVPVTSSNQTTVGGTIGGGGTATVPNTGSAPALACGCPACEPGAPCPLCACGTTPPDPCAAHTDAKTCAADQADSCGWISLNIECIAAPCPTGSCAKMETIGDGGSGGCVCGCPACAPGEVCPPCACDCCPGAVTPPEPGPVEPQPAALDGGSAPIGL